MRERAQRSGLRGLTRRALLAALAAGAGAARAGGPSLPRDDAARLRRARDAARRIARRFRPFEPTDWSRKHPEETAQTLDAYVATRPNRPDAKRTTLYIQPIGEPTETQRRVVTTTSALLRLWFGTPVTWLPPIASAAVPARAKRVHPEWNVPQLLSDYLLYETIAPRVPNDAVAVLGLTTVDLWPGAGWNFVFGVASLRDRVGVWSLARYGDPDAGDAAYRLYRLRALKVAAHETGHLLGIPHCVSYACGMNGSNTLPETDAAPLAFCPECSAKLWWATRADPAAWLRGLRDFAAEHQLAAEGRVWADSLRDLAAAPG